ncbi:MAG: hypothetical protein A2140_03820 [Candidatus Muproteobacteria bacterium RBG_16_62_13]|uniref:CARDB domain-containing protein n=1 Tax=Candidatus Muproteobacteria bacterium RBG_16_62_13 TaxID=1817756 RepID=A0A1F6T3F7_9PROT|nr:MAG: hypothetical protein A2140_03820 [Candidatus Muproteobacteria bacterium RBG_16_62_13]
MHKTWMTVPAALLAVISTLVSAQAAPPNPGQATPLPDLTSAPFIVIAGKNVSWGNSISVDAKQARPAVGGVCEFPVQHNVRNLGKSASGPFQTRFDSNTVPGGFTRQWPSIAPGQASTQTDILRLRSGSNTLILHIDPANQVRESNEGNNQYRATIQVNGKCDPGKGTLR